MSELASEYQTAGKSNVTLSENVNAVYMSGSNSSIDSGERVMPRIQITVNRFGFGETTTLSRFIASAYDEYGKLVDTMEGYFLEPYYDPDRCHISGSDTAIPCGTYDVVPSTLHGRSGYYEVEGVSGRTAIKIHSGMNGGWTEGCLLTGSDYHYDADRNDYSFNMENSNNAMNSFRDFMNSHASGYATMTINP